jgi:cytochrome c biogenesis protein CcdA
VIDVPLATAFTAGLVAAVNPCGFPMLPAYLSWFIGMDDDEMDPAHRVPRALLSGLSVAGGFLLVFAALGIPINAGFSGIYRAMPWFMLVMGAGFIVLGGAMLRGYRLKVMLPRLERGGKTRRSRSMVVFGASYALASLSCTLPIFLVYVAGTARRTNWLSGLVAFLAYGAGFTLVLLALSLAIALARDSMVRRMRSLVRYADRAAAALMVVVGSYLVYYGVYALDSGNRSSTGVGVIDGWSSRASSWLERGGVTLGWVLAAVVASGLAWVLLRSRRAAGP